MATKPMRRINIIGHQNPDTDSICSALAYAWLKNRGCLEGLYEARRAGHINRETRFVLQHFGVEPPRLCTDVSPQIKDIDIRKQAGIDGEMSVRAAWNLMRDVEIDTLCIVDNEGELQGLITIKEIAAANKDLIDTAVLAAANTRCANLLETLEAESVVENYLDAAQRSKLGTVTIIHGKGTGALRAAVHQMLKKNRAVKSFRLGRYGEGEAYNKYFKNQLRELLTNYGDIFCVWFDGACGEGKNGRKQEYDWQGYYDLIRECQPEAVISVTGPDVRWCGNEAGVCRKSEWNVVPYYYSNQELIAAASQQTAENPP